MDISHGSDSKGLRRNAPAQLGGLSDRNPFGPLGRAVPEKGEYVTAVIRCFSGLHPTNEHRTWGLLLHDSHESNLWLAPVRIRYRISPPSYIPSIILTPWERLDIGEIVSWTKGETRVSLDSGIIDIQRRKSHEISIFILASLCLRISHSQLEFDLGELRSGFAARPSMTCREPARICSSPWS